MQLEYLVGFKLVDINDERMIVKKDNDVFVLEFDCYQGDCCGWAEVENSLLFDREDLNNNPVITKIDVVDNSGHSLDGTVITLFGEYKPMAKISAQAGSGSGWSYGAAVTVRCKPLEIDERLACW